MLGPGPTVKRGAGAVLCLQERGVDAVVESSAAFGLWSLLFALRSAREPQPSVPISCNPLISGDAAQDQPG